MWQTRPSLYEDQSGCGLRLVAWRQAWWAGAATDWRRLRRRDAPRPVTARRPAPPGRGGQWGNSILELRTLITAWPGRPQPLPNHFGCPSAPQPFRFGVVFGCPLVLAVDFGRASGRLARVSAVPVGERYPCRLCRSTPSRTPPSSCVGDRLHQWEEPVAGLRVGLAGVLMPPKPWPSSYKLNRPAQPAGWPWLAL